MGQQQRDLTTRDRILLGLALTIAIVGVVVEGLASARANQRADALREDVAATFNGATSADFLAMWNDDGINPPIADPELRLGLITAGGAMPISYGIDQNEVFALYRTGAFMNDRCVRVIINTSTVELDDNCVLIDRT